jgi:PhzF family phenazine biosynthesis protein
VLNALAPDFEALVALGLEIGAEGFFAFTQTGEAATEARMFCPALGIDEDPVSGNAHAMLAAYLWQYGRLDAAVSDFLGRQGRAMGRPGEVRVRLEMAGGELVAVGIGGQAVIVSIEELAA